MNMDRKQLRLDLCRVDIHPMMIERATALRQSELPSPSKATSCNLAIKDVLKHGRHVKPTIPNFLRVPELVSLSDNCKTTNT